MSNSLYRKAIKIVGIDAQLGLLQEECAELIQAVSKFKRMKPGSSANLMEEIVDVEIMIEQIKLAIFSDRSKCMSDIRIDKLNRLKEWLKG